MPDNKAKLINLPLLVNIFIGLLFAALLGIGTMYFLRTQRRETIAMSGTSSVTMLNQISSYSISVEESDADKAKAVEALTERVKQITQMVKDFGIPEEDIETTNLSVYQRQDQVYRDGVTTYEFGNWNASYTINVKLRDMSKSDDFTELLGSIEKASIWGPNLTIDDKEINEEELLSAAVEDARQKAEAVAASVGKKLGKVVQISEGSYSPVYGVAFDKGMGAGGGAGMPIEPGSTETSKSVVVMFELK